MARSTLNPQLSTLNSQPFGYSSNSFCGAIRSGDSFCLPTDTVCPSIHSEENNLNMKPTAMKLRIPSLPWLPSVKRPVRGPACQNPRPSVPSVVKSSRFRVFRDHKSRRDRLSLGTIIVAALGRQFCGLEFRRPPSSCSVFRGSNLRNPCPSVPSVVDRKSVV